MESDHIDAHSSQGVKVAIHDRVVKFIGWLACFADYVTGNDMKTLVPPKCFASFTSCRL